MITIQNIEISWTKDARGGRLATVRNAVPHAFEISLEREYQNFERYISLRYESVRIEDTATDKLISEISNLIFTIEDNALQIKMPKYNGYDKKIAVLQNGQSIQFIRFLKLNDLEYRTTYHKKIVNLVFSQGAIPLDYFLAHSFDYRFDEKSHIWTDKM